MPSGIPSYAVGSVGKDTAAPILLLRSMCLLAGQKARLKRVRRMVRKLAVFPSCVMKNSAVQNRGSLGCKMCLAALTQDMLTGFGVTESNDIKAHQKNVM